MTRILIIALGLTTLLGCSQADLTGSWSGELDCDNDGTESVVAVAFDLEKDEKDRFSGEVTAVVEFVQVAPTQQGPITVGIEATLDGTVEAETDGTGEQEVGLDLAFDDVDCDITLNGQASDFNCEDLDLDEEDFALDDGEEVSWDGEDTLAYEDASCEGTLTR